MRQNFAAQNEYFVHAFVDINVVSGNDVLYVQFCMLMPSCTKSSNIQNTIILMFFRCSWCDFRLESGEFILNARITITHVCFIALTFAGSSEDVWTLGLAASCSNSFLRTQQTLMHEKTCMIPIIKSIYLLPHKAHYLLHECKFCLAPYTHFHINLMNHFTWSHRVLYRKNPKISDTRKFI